MRKKAVFPGKFNPPHIGHARTIFKLDARYDLLVVVTRDVPTGAKFTPDQIAEEVRGLGVDVEIYDGVLTSADVNPWPGRIILSGNPAVIGWAESLGAECRHVPRAGCISGRDLRW